MLRNYLKQTGYKYGPLFRAFKNFRGGSLRYQSVQQKWSSYCKKAGITCSIHDLRHAHATELINNGVSLNTIRKRLGHKNLQTTIYIKIGGVFSLGASVLVTKTCKLPSVTQNSQMLLLTQNCGLGDDTMNKVISSDRSSA